MSGQLHQPYDDHAKVYPTSLLTDVVGKVLIFPTFYEQLFCAKEFFEAFLHLQFVFGIFGNRKLVQKLLEKCW